MGIFDRLGSVINSYLNDFGDDTNRRFNPNRTSSGDPDLDAAYDELNDFLNRDKQYEKKQNDSGNNRYSWKDDDSSYNKKTTGGHHAGNQTNKPKTPSDELRADYELLGVPFGSGEETCKQAYKKLLKIHHPDKHAGHEGNYKKATEKTAKINAAYDRIEKYLQGKK